MVFHQTFATFNFGKIMNLMYMTFYYVIITVIPFLAIYFIVQLKRYRMVVVEFDMRKMAPRVRFKFARKVKTKEGIIYWSTIRNKDEYKAADKNTSIFNAGYFDLMLVVKLNERDYRTLTIDEKIDEITPMDEDTVQWIVSRLAKNDRKYEIANIIEKYGPIIVSAGLLATMIIALIFTYRYGETVVSMIQTTASMCSNVMGPTPII